MSKDTLKHIRTGTVVSVDDPTKHGRIKVRIEGLNDNVDVERLPWCNFGGSAFFSGTDGGSISIPRVGTKVRVRFHRNDVNSMEWYGTNRIDKKLAEELAKDYEGAHAILYDSASDLSIMYQNQTGLRFYYKGTFIQLSPNNDITLYWGGSGDEDSGIRIQMSQDKIDIQHSKQIVLTAGDTVKIEAPHVVLDGSENVQIRGDRAGDYATNAKELYKLLTNLATSIDMKIPATGGKSVADVKAAQSLFSNQKIQFI